MWAVVAVLPENPERVVAVSLTTKRSDADTTVVFDIGDHQFIKHETVVNYTDARVFNRDELIKRINDKFFEEGQPFKQDKIEQMQQGLLKSTLTPTDIKSLCEKVFKDNVTGDS